MRSCTHRFAATMVAVLLATVCCDAAAQTDARHTFMLRHVSLEDALDRFSHSTGISIAYDPGLLDGQTIFCVARNASPEETLRCILRDTNLDFYRLSSGTFVIVPSTAALPRRGGVRGTVVDQSTGLPIRDAFVHFREERISTYTNSGGHFAHAGLRQGEHVVRISHIGYHTRQDTLAVSPGASVGVVVSLQPSTAQMEPVVIDGYVQKALSRRLGRATIDAEQLAMPSLPATLSAHQALNRVTGVRTDPSTAGIHIQEGAPGEHEFRLDGVPIFTPIQVHGMVGMLSPLALKQITVHKAGFGAQHGNSTSGVVLAEHKLRMEGDHNLEFRVDPVSIQASAHGGHRRADAMVALRSSLWQVYRPHRMESLLRDWGRPDYFFTDAPAFLRDGEPPTWDPARGSIEARPQHHFVDLHGAARWQVGAWSHVDASYYHGSNELSNQPAARAAALVEDRYNHTNDAGQIRLNSLIGARFLGGLQMRASRYRLSHTYRLVDSLRVVYDDPVFYSTRTLIDRPVEDGNEIREAAAILTVEYAAGRRHNIEGSLEASLVHSRFEIVAANSLAHVQEVFRPAVDTLVAERREIAHAHRSGMLSGFISDRITMSPRILLELGARISWPGSNQPVYAEPRIALRYDADPSWGFWSARLATGLYRRFTTQLDVSSATIGALVPAARFWVPPDGTVSPAKAYHIAGDVLVGSRRGLEAHLEAFARIQPHINSLRYVATDSSTALGYASAQRDFLEGGNGHTVGVAAHLKGGWRAFDLDAGVALSRERRRATSRFENRYVPSPWHEPLRMKLGLAWNAPSGFSALLRTDAAWGRSWGYNQAYYDYYGSDARTRYVHGVDFGMPDLHRLPPDVRLDIGLRYDREVGSVRVMVSADVLNVLNRENVMDRVLHFDGTGSLERRERHYLRRMPIMALHVRW